MSALRRRHRRAPVGDQPPPDDSAPRPTTDDLERERILLTLVSQTQQLNDRLTRLEDRFEAAIHDQLSQVDEQDLLELRLHSARLAAELSRVTVELRARIDELAAQSAVAAEVIDLTAEPPRLGRRPRSGGWQPLD